MYSHEYQKQNKKEIKRSLNLSDRQQGTHLAAKYMNKYKQHHSTHVKLKVMIQTLQAQKPVHVVYSWMKPDGLYYFVSKAVKDSPVITKDEKNIQAPDNPEQIRIIKEFDQEEDALEFIDQLVYALVLESDG